MHAALKRIALLTACLVLPGCVYTTRYLNEHYGARSAVGSDSSVNGVSVLGEMFNNAGHRVRSWRLLSPALEKADVIVWFPNDFDLTSPTTQVWLDDWLLWSEQGKTLIIVGRDFEAGANYWSLTRPRAPNNQQPEFATRQRESQNRYNSQRSTAPASGVCNEWYSIDSSGSKRAVKKLTGPWSKGVDSSKAAIEHHRYLTPAANAAVLLADGQGHPLVSEISYEPDSYGWRSEPSRLILIENGSFLLNAPLVNKEHRKIAGKLVDHIGPPKQEIIFLEAGANPPIQDADPDNNPPTLFRLFTIWPIGAVLAQFIVLGLVYAIARFPIFGVPRRLERVSLTDFGKHVAALGKLLAATGDRAYADSQLRAYFDKSQAASTDSAASTKNATSDERTSP